jgi:hypothetical protein
VALIAAPILVCLVASFAAHSAAASGLRLPPGRADWQGPLETPDDAWRREFAGDHEERRVAYQDGAGRKVEVLAVGYPRQEQGRELVNEDNALLGHGGLKPLTREVLGDYGYWEVVAVDNDGHRWVIWSTYDIGERTFVIPIIYPDYFAAMVRTARADRMRSRS